MAKPIEPTPDLEGKDAERFLKDMGRSETIHNTNKEKFLGKCEELYKKTVKGFD